MDSPLTVNKSALTSILLSLTELDLDVFEATHSLELSEKFRPIEKALREVIINGLGSEILTTTASEGGDVSITTLE